ncbi:CHAT domain-containing protein [Olleya sp. R77988]|uniref:CHAT domain-containing protein n=1 Tax=Olleya sp. R77988 TaxID=3093875 RepID=UPI0037CB3B5C
MYTNQDSTQFYKQKILKLANDQSNHEKQLFTYLVSNKSALIFNNLKELKNNLKHLDSLMLLAEKEAEIFKDFDEYKNSFLHDKAAYYLKQNNYNKAKENLNLIFINSNKIPDSLLTTSHRDLIDVSYKFMAKIHSNNGEYEQALQYLDKSIRYINSKNADSNNYLLNAVYRQKSDIYKKLKDYKKANFYSIKSLNYTLKNNANNLNQLINEVNNTTENYIALKQYDSAAYYLDQIKPYADTNIPYGFLYYKSKAKLNEAIGNTSDVEENYKKTLKLLNKKWNGRKQVEIANTLQSYSNYAINNGQSQKALKQNIAATQQVQGEDVINSSINQITLFKLLQQKAFIELRLNTLDSVIKTTKQATRLLDTLKPTFKNKTDKLLLIENAYTLFENGLNATYSNYKSNKEDAVNNAFFFLEKSKSTLLLEALLSVKAENFSNIPEAILAKEQIYKNTITTIEKQLNRKQNDVLKDKLFTTKTNYRQFLDTLETNYKEYYKLKYDTKTQSLNALQNQLTKTQAVVSYFYGNQSIFSLTITSTSVHFNKITITKGLVQQIQTFQKQLSNPKSNLNQLNANAKQLYSILLKPGLENIQVDKLTILPDGLLNYIPFETLIKDSNYLVEDYAISYINSATLLKELNDKQDNKNNLLAFAPEFKGDIVSSDLRLSLQPLPHNTTEVENIKNYYSGSVFTNKEATLKNFKTNAANFGIIHLATHAIFNDSNPEYSYLAFGNEEQDLLYVSDLYNLDLKTNLVTLSACESGIGDLKRGEGLLSLARGFYFSGAQSISSTLWKINDASSTTLMSNFYQNLSTGQTKNLALQQAKLNFIKQNKDNALSHPYYWSAFIISGNTDALTTTNYWAWIGLSITGLVLIGFFMKRKKLI